MEKILYDSYVDILKEELIVAMGCTEPIALAYCASYARDTLDDEIKSVNVYCSGNIIKNVKSVVVPHTGGLKGIEAAVTAGLVGGQTDLILEVIAHTTKQQQDKMSQFMEETPIKVLPLESSYALDMIVELQGTTHRSSVRIAKYHTNIIEIKKDNEIIFSKDDQSSTTMSNRDCLNIEDIYEFAHTCQIDDVKDVLQRQIDINMAIAEEGMEHSWGANIGSTLVKAYGNNVRILAKAYAAAGSDARMSGCELPVVINSGSGNQGMTTSIPVVVYGREMGVSEELLYRALIIANLCTIHLKSSIGRLSAYCGAVSAGVGAGCGIAYLHGGDYKTIAHTIVNAVAIVSGMVCDGAKPSCAAKIAAAVDAGILGYEMYLQGDQFKSGEGIVTKGVENTIRNIGRLGQEGMKETDKEIIKMMCERGSNNC